jgi:hypothetical protein
MDCLVRTAVKRVIVFITHNTAGANIHWFVAYRLVYARKDCKSGKGLDPAPADLEDLVTCERGV